MKALIQKVEQAKVEVSKEVVGKITTGILILLAVSKDDSKKQADWLLEKIVNLRIFPDEHGKMNKSIKDIGGQLLIVSQFTLLGDCKKGNRPSFDKAASSDKANQIYNYFIEKAKIYELDVSCGKFAAHMQVSLINDGPVTFVIDTDS